MNGVKVFKGVSAKEYKYTVDYSESKKGVSESAAARGLAFNDTSVTVPSGITPLRLYAVGGMLFGYFTDGFVYAHDDGGWQKCSSHHDGEPEIIQILEYAEVKYLILSPSVREYAFTKEETDIPYGQRYLVHRGMLFVAAGALLTYSQPFDSLNFKSSTETDNLLFPGGIDREIYYLGSLGEDVAVLYQEKLFLFSPVGGTKDYTLKEVVSDYICALKDTAAVVGGRLIFVSDGRLCEFYNGKLTYIGGALGSMDFTVADRAAAFKGVYLLPVYVGNVRKIYCYDSVLKREFFISNAEALSGTCGYSYHSSGKIMQLDYCTEAGGTTLENVQYGGAFDFGTCEKKKLLSIGVHAVGSAKITISGKDFSKTFAVTGGCNLFRTNMDSDTFTVGISDKSESFSLKKLVFRYMINGG